MDPEQTRKNLLLRPQVAGVIVLIIVGGFAADMLLRKPELPKDDGQPTNTTPDKGNKNAGGNVDLPKNSFRVPVIEAPDGDSLVVTLDGKRTRVRLQGVDCPERAQAFGDKARQFSNQLMQGKTVTLIKHGTDQYDRVLASVTLPDGRDLGEALVQAGLAWQYRRYNQDASLQQLQQQAKSAHRGLWADENPTPPWQWRRDNPRD